jgi:TonB family protein
MPHTGRHSLLLWLGLCLCSPAPVEAQEAGSDPATPPKPVLAPPSLETFVEAEYPAEALSAGLMGRVELELVIGADGAVSDARVATPAGHGFDEAALAAGKQLRFKPATRDGVPIPARIRFPYVFEIREEPPPEVEAAPAAARFSGKLVQLEDDEPLAEAKISISSADGLLFKETRSLRDGRFDFGELPAGSYAVRITAEGREESNLDEELLAGEQTETVYRLQVVTDPEAFGATARVPAPPREVTKRSIGKEQMTRMAGTRGDPLRTVELMPGVARPPLGAGALIVRGSAPQDSMTLFEGLPVPLLYHFGGLTSFINGRLLESVDFYPGNFSDRYGRRRGGVVDVQARDPARDRFHGVADLNLIDASLLVEAPLTDSWEFAAAARRSHIDLVFENFLPKDEVSAIAAPVYYDYQAITTYRPSEKDELRLMVYGSSDELALLFTKPTDAVVGGDLDLKTSFHRAHASWSRRLNDDLQQDTQLAVGSINLLLGFGDAFNFTLSGVEVYGRTELVARVSPKVRVISGLDILSVPGRFSYQGPPADSAEGNPDNGPNGTTGSNRDSIQAGSDFTVLYPAVYVETDLNLDPTRIVIGARVDYYNDIEKFSFDPRIVAHHRLSDQWSLKAGVGMFAQPPQFQESNAELGNPDLLPSTTVHTSVGAEYQPIDDLFISSDFFYKYLWDVVVGSEFGGPPFFTNDGEGRIYGTELMARVDPRGRFFGYLSYTLSKSERSVREGPWQPFDFDQTHILTVSGVYRLGKGWEAGATFRLVTGNPSTPVIGSSYNDDTGQYSPVFGELNSERNPTFNRLDIRIEKLWRFKAWRLALYLDMQNVYNATNQEGLVYDYEYRESEPIRGLPILPNLGIRGEM